MAEYSSQPPDPDDALQALLNQANMQAGPTPMQSVGEPAKPPPPDPKSMLPVINTYRTPHAQGLMEQYGSAQQDSMLKQGLGLDQLDKYIQGIAQKPQGINWSPLAAYIDSQDPKSHMLAAAQAMAPMSAEQKDQMLFDLQNKLQGGRAQLSKENVQVLADKAKMIYQQQHAADEKKHWDAQDEAAVTRADNSGVMAGARQDNQAAMAVKEIHRFPAILQMRQQATNIAKGQELLNGEHVPNKTLSEVAQDYAAALSGKAAASDFKLKDLMTPSAQGEMRNALAWFGANPGDQDAPPQVLAYWKNMGERLSGTYKNQMSAAAQSRLTGLKTAFAHNPNAYDAAKEAADSYKNGAWMGDEGLADTSTSHHDYGSSSHVDDAGNTWVVKEGHWVKK